MFDSYVKLPAGNLAPLNLVGIASNPLLHCRDLAMQKTKKKLNRDLQHTLGHNQKRLVGGLGHGFYFPIYWISHHPN